MTFLSKVADFWDPEIGEFDIKHLIFVTSTSHDLNNLFVLFITINMAAKIRQKACWIFQKCKDCDHENMEVLKLNVLYQISLSQNPKNQ